VLPYYQQYLQAAQALGQTPFNPAMLGSIAPLANEQIGAGSTLYNLGQQIPGVAGQFNNFANQLAANLNPVYNTGLQAAGLGQDWGNFATNVFGQIGGPVAQLGLGIQNETQPIYNTGAGAMGQAQPFINLGQSMQQATQPIINLGMGMQQQVQPIVGLGMQAGQWDPAMVRSLESPYTQDVVNATQGWFNNQNQIQANDLLSQGIRAGNAFGGDRAGIAAAQLAGQQQLAQAPVIAGLYNQGYSQALQEFNALRQLGLSGGQLALAADQLGLSGGQLALQGLGTQLQGGQLGLQGIQTGLQGGQLANQALGTALQGGQLALGAGNLGMQAGQLGISGAQLGLQGGQLANQTVGMQGNLAQQGLQGLLSSLQGPAAAIQYGNMLQQQQQRQLDIAQQNAMLQSAYPFQTANWLGSVLGGIGPLTGSFQQGYTTPPSPNQLSQALAIATGLSGIGTTLFGPGGLFGSKYGGPVGGLATRRRRRGGPVAGLRPRINFRDGGLTYRADGGPSVADIAASYGVAGPVDLQTALTQGAFGGSAADWQKLNSINPALAKAYATQGGTFGSGWTETAPGWTKPAAAANFITAPGGNVYPLDNTFGAPKAPPYTGPLLDPSQIPPGLSTAGDNKPATSDTTSAPTSTPAAPAQPSRTLEPWQQALIDTNNDFFHLPVSTLEFWRLYGTGGPPFISQQQLQTLSPQLMPFFSGLSPDAQAAFLQGKFTFNPTGADPREVRSIFSTFSPSGTADTSTSQTPPDESARARGGLVQRRFARGGTTDDYDDDDDTTISVDHGKVISLQGGLRSRAGTFAPLPNVAGTLDVSGYGQQDNALDQLRRLQQQQQQKDQSKDPNDPANQLNQLNTLLKGGTALAGATGLKSLLGTGSTAAEVGGEAAPIGLVGEEAAAEGAGGLFAGLADLLPFALFAKRGGIIARRQDGGDTDDDDDFADELDNAGDEDQPVEEDTGDEVVGVPGARRMSLETGGDEEGGPPPDYMQLAAQGAPTTSTTNAEGQPIDANGNPIGPRPPVGGLARAGAGTPGGLMGRQLIPPAPTMPRAQQIGQALLAMSAGFGSNRSPYFAPAIGNVAGSLYGMNEARLKQEKLDRKPQFMDTGKEAGFMINGQWFPVFPSAKGESLASRERIARERTDLLRAREQREAARPVIMRQGIFGPEYGRYNPNTRQIEPIQAPSSTIEPQQVPESGSPGSREPESIKVGWSETPEVPLDMDKDEDKAFRAVYQQWRRDVAPVGAVTQPQLIAQQRNEAALSGMNPREQKLIRGLADYSINPTSIPARRRDGVLAAVMDYDPSYNQANYAARAAALKNFGASGVEARNFQSNDMALQHIGSYIDNINELERINNSDYGGTLWNQLRAGAKTFAGDKHLQNVLSAAQTDVHIIGAELSRTFRGAGQQSQKEAADIRDKLQIFGPPSGQRGAVVEAAKLIGGRINASANFYNQTMGPGYERPPESWLSNKGREELRRAITMNPEQSAVPARPQGGGRPGGAQATPALPQPKNKSEYDALAPGARYLRNGKTMIKQ